MNNKLKEHLLASEMTIQSGDSNWPDELKKILGTLIDLASRITTTNNQTFKLNEIVTADELAARFKVPVSTIEELARKRKLPGAFRVGKHWRFDIDLLRSALANVESLPFDK